ncbi:MAG: glycosyltransferase [Myxococcota bacterium]|nr:glycosyltransferase [Myxococcota bacterium]
METTTSKKSPTGGTPAVGTPSGGRPRIALITNHGYAGVEIPVGGAPDTGGQNFYVNSLAAALEDNGFDVTIFARGGFPFFGIEKIREGVEQLSEHVRYIYVPGGGDQFIRKEDIAVALDEETVWIQAFIEEEAQKAGIDPWAFFEIINSHYWDAAVIAVKLIERWRDEAARDFLSVAAGGKLAPHLEKFAGTEVHRLCLSREISLHLGEIARATASNSKAPSDIVKQLIGPKTATLLNPDEGELVQTIHLGETLVRLLRVDGVDLQTALRRIDTHVFTPHSLGIVKERNFWYKNKEVIRSLKFRERDAHEHVVCRCTSLFCATSLEISRALLSYHGVAPEGLFDFPPCINAGIFKPRSKAALDPVYQYLAERSHIPADQLKGAKIVFETSRMDKTKRKDILLQAFAKICESNENSYLFIGGGPSNSPVFQELKEIKASLPALDGRAFLLGYVPGDIVEPLFSLPDLFVSASEMEGFGMSASQAAAAGVCVIASDLIPFATQFAKGAAVVVPAGDVDGFAQAMEALLNDDKERQERAKAVFEIARTLDWKATAQRFIDWFRESRKDPPYAT